MCCVGKQVETVVKPAIKYCTFVRKISYLLIVSYFEGLNNNVDIKSVLFTTT